LLWHGSKPFQDLQDEYIFDNIPEYEDGDKDKL
jgi:hypothetical protein